MFFVFNRFADVLSKEVENWSFDETQIERKKIQVIARKLHELSIKYAIKDLESDPDSSLSLCLHHHDGSVRECAVKKLVQNTDMVSKMWLLKKNSASIKGC